jgi:DNA-directed RNA polymerase sigma subunit (sigma70/sigma32)
MTVAFSTIFSLRTCNRLYELYISTWEELIKHTEYDMLKSPNFGRKTLGEITDFLAKYNMKLGSPYINDDIKHTIIQKTIIEGTPPFKPLFTPRETDLLIVLCNNKTITLDEIGLELNVSKTRVRELISRCYMKLRYTYEISGNEAYLPSAEMEHIIKERRKTVIHYIENYFEMPAK